MNEDIGVRPGQLWHVRTKDEDETGSTLRIFVTRVYEHEDPSIDDKMRWRISGITHGHLIGIFDSGADGSYFNDYPIAHLKECYFLLEDA